MDGVWARDTIEYSFLVEIEFHGLTAQYEFHYTIWLALWSQSLEWIRQVYLYVYIDCYLIINILMGILIYICWWDDRQVHSFEIDSLRKGLQIDLTALE